MHLVLHTCRTKPLVLQDRLVLLGEPGQMPIQLSFLKCQEFPGVLSGLIGYGVDVKGTMSGMTTVTKERLVSTNCAEQNLYRHLTRLASSGESIARETTNP